MSNGCARVCGAARKNVASLEKHKRQRQKPLPFMLVEATGFAPWADAHGKQRVTAVLSSVETSDLRNLWLLASRRHWGIHGGSVTAPAAHMPSLISLRYAQRVTAVL